MAETETELRNGDPEEWEKRTLNLIKGSEIDQEFSALKSKKAGRKNRHKIKKMNKPMVLPCTLLEFMDDDLREAAIRYLSTFLIEKREEDMDNYDRAGFLIFHSFGTMTILLQEVVEFIWKMDKDPLEVRSIKRLANVLTMFQCVAANSETRQKFIDSSVPNFLIPLIQCTNEIELFDNIRAIALSVIGILCQAREPTVIKWAIESNMLDICSYIIDKGSELTKVIAMHILEAILQDSFGIQHICNPISDHILKALIRGWDELVTLLAADRDFSPRLLFHIIRCYILLSTNKRGYNIVMENLPQAILNNSFKDMIEVCFFYQ
ncbi:CCR4-NOT transcription complex subunit 9 protein [Dioscorea alata]|uniref:CCR4-NOT transcription complex subunit 9 protein n=1 Tax=Dioscorea alata TaxID=55571 RepID=A0ACB7WQB5_DIOAL|nr:CCR4-NOT transcription complex subunit 9 protein [Dioscorea alata]